MDKTKVDDMQMITPKVKEIEEKFGNGKPLTQEDINTLLLKSQYNHINHLDTKLNEVTADVASLKSDFKLLETSIKKDNELFKAEIKSEISDLKKGNELFKAEIKSEMSDIKNEMKTFKKEIQLEISTAINSNMKWSIGLIALIVTGLKVLDMFMQ
jgi:hypothetical protein